MISLIHDFLQKNQKFKPKKIYLQADNCVAQNKSNAVMQYLFWRVLQNLNTDIKISFMIAGHKI